jgi:hypothetical protein
VIWTRVRDILDGNDQKSPLRYQASDLLLEAIRISFNAYNRLLADSNVGFSKNPNEQSRYANNLVYYVGLYCELTSRERFFQQSGIREGAVNEIYEKLREVSGELASRVDTCARFAWVMGRTEEAKELCIKLKEFLANPKVLKTYKLQDLAKMRETVSKIEGHDDDDDS